MSLLSIENLSLAFGEHAVVKQVSLAIQKGEMMALVGESGSGKSLTALSCLGLQPAGTQLSGTIHLAGQAVLDNGQAAQEAILRSVRGKVASMIFQEPMTALNPLHTIGKQIAEMFLPNTVIARSDRDEAAQPSKLAACPDKTPAGNGLHRFARNDDTHDKILRLLDSVGLSHFKARLDAYPHQLSGGERQRVMIAMAIANNPQLLIADEPTTAVDVTIQAKLLKLLKQLQKERGMAMLFITHDLTIVRRLADRVAVMKAGEIVEQGKVSDIFSNPQHPYTKQLLGSEPKGAALPLPADALPLMRCEQLKVHFPIKKGVLGRTVDYTRAVDGISLTLLKGATLGIVGESGSGKTTLGFALLRLIRSEGRIVFMGEETSRLNGPALRALRQHMQLVFQDPYSSLNPRMTIGQIIEEGLLVHEPKTSPQAREQKIDAALEEVGLLPALKHRFPHEFSGGQRQRVSIARAMVLRPRLIILDEPTSALDLTVQSQIIDLLKKFQKDYGLSYIFISHDLRVIRAISHRIVVMKNGKIVEEGDTQTLFESPREAYTQTLIEAAFLKN